MSAVMSSLRACIAASRHVLASRALDQPWVAPAAFATTFESLRISADGIDDSTCLIISPRARLQGTGRAVRCSTVVLHTQPYRAGLAVRPYARPLHVHIG